MLNFNVAKLSLFFVYALKILKIECNILFTYLTG